MPLPFQGDDMDKKQEILDKLNAMTYQQLDDLKERNCCNTERYAINTFVLKTKSKTTNIKKKRIKKREYY